MNIKLRHNLNQQLKLNMHRKVHKFKCKSNLFILIILNLFSMIICLEVTSVNNSFNSIFKHDYLNTNNSLYYFEIKENSPENCLVGKLNLTTGFTYRFGGYQIPLEFKLNSSTGELFTTKIKLDRERQEYYNLALISYLPQPLNPIEVKIKVLDENDNEPFWLDDDKIKEYSFLESAQLGSNFTLYTAFDLDKDILTYELHLCTRNTSCSCDEPQELFSNKFTLHNPFGLVYENLILSLKLMHQLDREQIDHYSCRLCVFDLVKHFSSIQLNINILDVNDNVPLFTQTDYNISVNNQIKKGDLLLKVTANDLDEPNSLNSKISYFFHDKHNLIKQNNFQQDFYINQSTGEIFSTHDGLPKFFSSHISSYSQVCSNNNCTNRNAFVFTVLAEDHGTPKQIGRTFVTVNFASNVNLHSPKIKFLYFNHRMQEYAYVDQSSVHGTAVAAISVFDNDTGINGKTKLKIVSGNELRHFYLDSDLAASGSYVLRVNLNSPFPQPKNNWLSNYNLTITANDLGKPALTTSKYLIIKVKNSTSPDYKPSFDQSVYKIELSEHTAIGSFVYSVTAKHKNEKNTNLNYFSLSGNNSDYFFIDSQTGLITLVKKLDRELIDYIELKVLVRETALHSKWTSAKLIIEILDENDNIPEIRLISKLDFIKFKSSNYLECQLNEKDKFNLDFTTHDLDAGLNGTVNVEILYDYNGLFTLNRFLFSNKESILKLSSTQEFDYEKCKEYDIVLIISDSCESNKLKNEFKIKILINDQDDNLPLVYPKHIFIHFKEDLVENQKLAEIKLLDLDQTTSTKFIFNFNNNHKNLNLVNELISLNEFTGEIYLKKKINTLNESISFNITCDGCNVSNDRITIHLYFNHFKNEVFLQNTLNISEDLKISSLILDKIISNSDNKHNLIILDGDAKDIFSLSNNQLILSKQLDYEDQKFFNLVLCNFNSFNFKLIKIKINILDVNDEEPYFQTPFIQTTIQRNHPFNSSFLKLESSNFSDRDKIVYYKYEFVNCERNDSVKSNILNGNHLFRIEDDLLILNKNLMNKIISIENKLIYKYSNSIYCVCIKVKNPNLNQTSINFKQNLFIYLNQSDHYLRENNFQLAKTFYELNINEALPVNTKILKLDFVFKNIEPILDFHFEFIENSIDWDLNKIRNQFSFFPDGTLYIKNRLDREDKDYYFLRTRVLSKNDPYTSDHVEILIKINDYNDNMPEFKQKNYVFYVNENMKTFFGTVEALDKDEGFNSLIKYKILNNNYSNLIEINSETGFLYTKIGIDYEQIKTIKIEVEAEDQALFGKRLKSTCNVEINIIDLNDNSPYFEFYNFTSNIYLRGVKVAERFFIQENTKLNTVITQFKVNDEDSNSKITYKLIESAFSNKFYLNSQTGQLILLTGLDREINEKIELLIEASDGFFKAYNRFTLNLIDVNDNAPLFYKKNHDTVRIKENTTIGTSIYTFKAIDYDIGLNGLIYYEINSIQSLPSLVSKECKKPICKSNDCFKIENENLYVIQNLDYESEIEYLINITAFDYYGLRSAPFLLKIIIEDINDCLPQFKTDFSLNDEFISILENNKINTLLTKIHASDCDLNDKLIYEITKCQITGFYDKIKCPIHLDSTSPNLILSSVLDYEKIKRISLEIKVSDEVLNSNYKNLTILVENLNDNSPKFESSNSIVIIRDKSFQKNDLLGQIYAIDRDGDKVIYKLLNELLSEENNSGLSFIHLDENTAVDSERLNSNDNVELTLIVNTNRTIRTFDILIEVNENENSETILKEFLCDHYNSCKFFLNSPDRTFSLNQTNGQLKLKKELDREFKDNYYLDIIDDNKLQIKIYRVHIKVLDINDNKPVFKTDWNQNSIQINENHRVGTQVFNILNNLIDLDLNNVFTIKQINCSSYFNNRFLQSFNENEFPFFLDQNTGKIFLNKEIDREKEDQYKINFTVSDGVFSLIDILNIEVIDVNDNCPEFEQKFISFNVLENTLNNTIVGNIEAYDKDLNSILRYKIISEQYNSPFKLNEKTGDFYLIRSVDYETDNHLYISVVQATDGQHASLPVTICFNIINLNDNSPLFESSEFLFALNDNTTLNQKLFCLDVYDLDEISNLNFDFDYDEQMFQILDYDLAFETFFKLSNKDGCFELIRYLNETKLNSFKFNVKVSDGIHQNKAKVIINILRDKIENINSIISRNESIKDLVIYNDKIQFDLTIIHYNIINMKEVPIFLGLSPKIKWCENTVGELGQIFIQFRNVILNQNSNNSLKLSIKSIFKDYFLLDQKTGKLSIVQPFDKENISNPYIELKIIAKNESNLEFYIENLILIEILDLNDNIPIFEKNRYLIKVNEEVEFKKSHTFFKIIAKDKDEKANLTFKLIQCKSNFDKNNCDKIDLNKTTGELYSLVDFKFDRELEKDYLFIIQAFDEVHFSYCNLTIEIQDENDCQPKLNRKQTFSNLVKKEFLNENHLKVILPYEYFLSDSYLVENDNLFLFGLNVFDNDQWNTLNSKIQFKFIKQNHKGFKINKFNGVISIENWATRSLNFHKSNFSAYFELIINDLNLKQNLSSKLKLDLILYENKEIKWKTIFEPIFNSLKLNETTLPNTSIYSFKPIELDAFKLKDIDLYIVGGDYDHRFRIEFSSNTFNLILNKRLSYKHQSNYTIYVEAVYKKNVVLFQIIELNFEIIDEMENQIYFNQSIYEVSITEEQPKGTFVIQLNLQNTFEKHKEVKEAFDFTAFKEDEIEENEDHLSKVANIQYSKNIKFSILTPNVPFQIDEHLGIIVTSDKIDRELNDEFNLLVELENLNNHQKVNAKVIINIIDENDNPPHFTQHFSVNISENLKVDTFLIQVTCDDQDKNKSINQFSLDDNRFKIDTLNGKVYLVKQLDRETSEEIHIKITVSDGWWKAETTLTIYIEDINDNWPIFDSCSTLLFSEKSYDNCLHHFEYINLNDTEDQIIGQLFVNDLDKGINSEISFQVLTETNLFLVEKNSGLIIKKADKNHENNQSIFNMEIRACDNGKIPKCTNSMIFITKAINLNKYKSLPLPIDLSNSTKIYEFSPDLKPIFASCRLNEQTYVSDIFLLKNNSLYFIGNDQITSGQIFYCNVYFLFNDPFGLKIIITRKNYFEPLFLNDQSKLTISESNHNFSQPLMQFKAIDNDIDFFNNEVEFKMDLVSIKFNVNSLEYYHKNYIQTFNDKYYSYSIQWLISQNEKLNYLLNPFKLDLNSGFVYLIGQLDFELIIEYKYKIKVMDKAVFNQKDSNLLFEFKILDSNDNPPLVMNLNENNEIDLFVEENNEIGSIIYKVQTMDFDQSDHLNNKKQNISFELDFEFIDAKYFILDGTNLKTLISFDYEKKNFYKILINLIDFDKQKVNFTINIHIQDINEFKPKFTKQSFEFDLIEECEIGTIIGNLSGQSIDMDSNSSVKYILLKNLPLGIELKENGLIIVNDLNDFEQNLKFNQHTDELNVIRFKFTILAVNGNVSSYRDFDKSELIINLINLNEPPLFLNEDLSINFGRTKECLVVRSRSCLYAFRSECKIKAIDYDQNDLVRYKLLNGNHFFNIDELNGTITLINCNNSLLFDFKFINKSHELLVAAIDSSGLQTKTYVSIKFDSLSMKNTIYKNQQVKNYFDETTLKKEIDTSKWFKQTNQISSNNLTKNINCIRKISNQTFCECKQGFRGPLCNKIDLCYTSKEAFCLNGGICKQNENERYCLCRIGFRGLRCEKSLTYCTGKSSKCGLNGICQEVKPFGYRCECLDEHTFGHECNEFSLGLKPYSYIRLNTSLNELINDIVITFASYFNYYHYENNIDEGQLILYNHGNFDQITGKSDFIALELYANYVLLRISTLNQVQITELKVHVNKYNLVDGKYYKIGLMRNRKIAHLSIYACNKLLLDNQLNCNQLLNQSSITISHANLNFDSNPLWLAGLDAAYSSKNYYQTVTKGHLKAKKNFVGCLHKVTMNLIRINQFISEKNFVDPICRPNLPTSTLSKTYSKLETNQTSSILDCKQHCGASMIACKQDWYEIKCVCLIKLSTLNNSIESKENQFFTYETNLPCHVNQNLQFNKKSSIKLVINSKWNNLFKNKIYQNKFEQFTMRFYLNVFTNNLANLWSNENLSIKLAENGTLYLVQMNVNLNKTRFVQMKGKIHLNDWNIVTIKSNGQFIVNNVLNEFEQNFKSNSFKSLSIGNNLIVCMSHLIINDHLIEFNDNKQLYEIQAENVEIGTSCKNVLFTSRIDFNLLSVTIILMIMFIALFVLAIATSFMLLNRTKTKKAHEHQNANVKSTIKIKKTHLNNANIANILNKNQLTNLNQSKEDNYYEDENFYYGGFFHNEKLASAHLNSKT